VGREYDVIDQHWRDWIARQPMFFVGTAPLTEDGHVNVSPKGPGGTLRVLDERTVAYLDVIGSGAETIAHLKENGRIVVMWCAFEGPPKILRVHGTGEVLWPGDPRYEDLFARCAFDELGPPEARRAIVVVHAKRIADSCGYGVPLMSFEGVRPHLDKSVRKKLRVRGENAMLDYQREKNAESIDGLPAVELHPSSR
jgi:hypothetical protein